jgi:Zn-dependent protease
MTAETIYLATTWIIPVLIAITFHEAAHGFVAHLLGDDTAWRLGRVSFNPLKHIDPVGTVLLPGILLLLRSPFLFGYAKPVPVNFQALRNPRRDMVRRTHSAWISRSSPFSLAYTFPVSRRIMSKITLVETAITFVPLIATSLNIFSDATSKDL